MASRSPQRNRTPPRSHEFNNSYGLLDDFERNIYINHANPVIIDDDGQEFFESTRVPRSRDAAELTYLQLLNLARDARLSSNRSWPVRREHIYQYFRTYHHIYGSPLDRYNDFASDAFWIATCRNIDPQPRTGRQPRRNDYNVDFYHETRAVPEMEVYDSDRESELDDDDYITFNYEDVRRMHNRLLETPQSTTNSYRRHSTRSNVNFWDEESEFGSPEYFSLDGRETWRSRIRINNRSTPAPNSDSDEEQAPRYVEDQMVAGFEGDYVDWDSDSDQEEGNSGDPVDSPSDGGDRNSNPGQNSLNEDAQRRNQSDEGSEDEEIESDNQSYSSEGVSDNSASQDQEPRVVLAVVNGNQADNENGDGDNGHSAAVEDINGEVGAQN